MGWGSATTGSSPGTMGTQRQGGGRWLEPLGWFVAEHWAMPQLITQGPVLEVSNGAVGSDSPHFSWQGGCRPRPDHEADAHGRDQAGTATSVLPQHQHSAAASNHA